MLFCLRASLGPLYSADARVVTFPQDHLSADSKDAVKLAMGLVATMTALVLGLLVSSAKDGYDTKRSEVIQLAANVTFLDRSLALYGPEAADARSELGALVETRELHGAFREP